MLELVSDDHIRHLVKKFVSNENSRDHLFKLLNAGPSGRVKILEEIDQLRPGTANRLKAEWLDHGASAVHPFTVPVYEGWSSADIIQEVVGRMKRTLVGGAPNIIAPAAPDEVGEHLILLRLTDGNVLEGHVDIVGQETYQKGTRFENKQKTSDVVVVRVYLDNPKRLTEVYAGYDQARRAMGGFAQGAFGLRHGRRKEQHFDPFAFTDTRVKMIAARLKLKQCRAEIAKSPDGKNGRVVIEGPMQGTQRLPIDLTEAMAAEVVDATNNERMFIFDYTHGDGFVETNIVQFTMRNTKAPGLLFLRRTSSSAKRWLLQELL
ncbi:MAG: hypothetical protein Q8P18_26870 [Pseudomonadota bacterium]|nr:hypothetical protein [Pseudomonadota bacterium]